MCLWGGLLFFHSNHPPGGEAAHPTLPSSSGQAPPGAMIGETENRLPQPRAKKEPNSLHVHKREKQP